MPRRLIFLFASLLLAIVIIGCNSKPKPLAMPPRLEREGDEIVVAGQLFHIGTPVVLWMDPGGYDAYRTERRFGPMEKADYSSTTQESWLVPNTTQPWTPNRYSIREKGLTTQQLEMVRGGGWPLDLLQQKVDQFVLHYDVAGISQNCFKTLQDHRNLSVHFMLDIDGTIYQTLDLKERARHATKANDRSIGIEIANMGSAGGNESSALSSQWYKKDADGRVRITIPTRLGTGGVRTPNFVGRPARNEVIVGPIRDRNQRQYDYTPEQYAALTKLTAGLCRVFPKLRCDYPKDKDGKLITRTLTTQEYDAYTGVLGHYHVQTNKSDPGPAMQWDLVINGARSLLADPTRDSAVARNSSN